MADFDLDALIQELTGSAPAANPVVAPAPATPKVDVPPFNPDAYLANVPRRSLDPMREAIEANTSASTARIEGLKQAQHADQDELKRRYDEYARAVRPSGLSALGDVFYQWATARAAGLPMKYATTGGIMTNSLPDVRPYLGALQANRQANLFERQQEAERQKDALGQFVQTMNMKRADRADIAKAETDAGNRNLANRLAVEQAESEDERSRLGLAKELYSTDAAVKMKEADLAEKANANKLTVTKFFMDLQKDSGKAVADDYLKVAQDRDGDAIIKNAQEANRQFDTARTLLEEGIREKNAAKVQNAMATVVRAYSGAAATDAEYGRTMAGNISAIEQAFNKIQTAFGRGIPAEGLGQEFLSALDTVIGKTNGHIAQRASVFEDRFRQANEARNRIYGVPLVDEGRRRQMFDPTPLLTQPRGTNPTTAANEGLPKIMNTVEGQQTFNKLPQGARFIDPDGNVRVKQ